jgi:hypothetical protein
MANMPDYLNRAMEQQAYMRIANREMIRWLAKYLDEKGLEHDLNPRRVLNMAGADEDYRTFIVKIRGATQRMIDEVILPELRNKCEKEHYRFKAFSHGSWLYPGMRDAKIHLSWNGDWRFDGVQVE